MNNTFEKIGVAALVAIGVSIIIGLFAVYKASVLFAGIYVGLIFSCGFLVLYYYCSKCECNATRCSHKYPGKLACKIKKKSNDPYTRFDQFITVLSVVVLLGFPQYWLLKDSLFLVIFWSFTFVGATMVFFYICPRCHNKKCIIQKKLSK